MITVIDRTNNRHEISGRLETIVAYLIENSLDIVKPDTAQLTFDCAGYTVKANIRKSLSLTSRPES